MGICFFHLHLILLLILILLLLLLGARSVFPMIELFGRKIGTYGLCAIAGLIVAGLVATVLGKKREIVFEEILMLMLSVACGLLIGGHAVFGLTNIRTIIQICKEATAAAPTESFKRLIGCFNGMVYYGGFLGATAALILYIRIAKVTVQKSTVLDIFAVSVPIFHTFGRIGCFFGGCCYGKISTHGFITYSNAINPSINGVVRLPVQLIEAGCNFAVFLLLLVSFLKGKQEGKLILWYMVLYPVIRFFLEFLRGDVIRGFLLGLSTSQWLSVLIFFTAVFLLVYRKRKDNRGACEQNIMTN